MNTFPGPTATRVTDNSADAVNRRIAANMEARVVEIARRGRPAIVQRLRELDREWDIERCLETGASSLTLLGAVLAARVDAKWLLLPAGVAAFLLQHALQGWCPPLPVLRRFGVRTADEINEERYALKALRGDFARVERYSSSSALHATRR